MPQDFNADRLAIREVVENWVLWRDSADWERFETVWHPDGWMTATWFQGPARDFIRVSREGFHKGVNILHFLGGWACEITGNRAISQVKMTIHQRATLDGVLVDVACIGRFFDFFEKRAGGWAIVRRQPIYEQDRLDPVDPSVTVKLDVELLSHFPEGYRHLAYLQTRNGFKVKQGLPAPPSRVFPCNPASQSGKNPTEQSCRSGPQSRRAANQMKQPLGECMP